MRYLIFLFLIKVSSLYAEDCTTCNLKLSPNLNSSSPVINAINNSKSAIDHLNKNEKYIDFEKLKKLAIEKYGKDKLEKINQFEKFLVSLSLLSEEEKINKLNSYINNFFQYSEDINVWNEVDYWATPLELFGKMSGDCEDLAILKYILLMHLGISPEKLKLSYVKIKNTSTSNVLRAHMVLKYTPQQNAESKILDTEMKEIYPASKRVDLIPFYDFNSKNIFVNEKRSDYSIDNHSKWKNCLQKMRAEGINI